MWPNPVTLTGQHVTLAPLSHDHAAGLKDAAKGLDALWYTSVPSPADMERDIDRRLGLQAAGSMLPFTQLDPSGRPVGMTTYMNIDAPNRRVEIGSTWLSRNVQRSPLNTQAKRLLLAHAFEDLNCIAVEFRTHRLNTQSRRAIERLGAQLDGILRAHMILANGTVRDTACYSITSADWPACRANLDWQLAKPRDTAY